MQVAETTGIEQDCQVELLFCTISAGKCRACMPASKWILHSHHTLARDGEHGVGRRCQRLVMYKLPLNDYIP